MRKTRKELPRIIKILKSCKKSFRCIIRINKTTPTVKITNTDGCDNKTEKIVTKLKPMVLDHE